MREGDLEKVLSFDQPFALIGTHERCHVRVGSSRGPDVTYLVCALAETIEVWPLAAIAFPRWGSIQPTHELLVGRQRITLHHSRVRSESPLVAELPDVAVNATLSWDGRPHEKTFRRHVTIIGDDHPSVLRLHGRGLATCDHAAVVQDGTLWLIDLVPDRWPAGPVCPVKRLAQRDDEYAVGDVQIRFVGTETQSGLPVEVGKGVNGKRAAGSQPAEKRSGKLDEGPGSDGGSDSDLLGSMETSSMGTSQSVASRVDAYFLHEPDGTAEAVRRKATGKSHTAPPPIVETVAPPVPPSEQLTARVTERLVSINHSRAWKQRVLWAVACLSGFGIAAVGLIRFLQVLMAPWLTQ